MCNEWSAGLWNVQWSERLGAPVLQMHNCHLPYLYQKVKRQSLAWGDMWCTHSPPTLLAKGSVVAHLPCPSGYPTAGHVLLDRAVGSTRVLHRIQPILPALTSSTLCSGAGHSWAVALGCALELCLNPHFNVGLCINNTGDEQAGAWE